jgi:hypothetical protein
MNSPQEVGRIYIDARNRHGIDAILDTVTDDFIYDERSATLDRPLQGASLPRVSRARLHCVPGSQDRCDIL